MWNVEQVGSVESVLKMEDQKPSPATQPLPAAYGNSPAAPPLQQGALPGSTIPQQGVYIQPPPAYNQNGFYEPNPHNRQQARKSIPIIWRR